MRRLGQIGDALSQLVNVALLPHADQTDANESISGRAHRMRWTHLERFIDALVFWQPRHCRRAYLDDVTRARRLLGLE